MSITPSMSVSVQDTKILWGRAAGRCSICRIELTVDVERATATIPLGEQAHIVAEESGGPRGDASLSKAKRNSYPNLILLCPTCHTRADKSPNDFPIGRLHNLKREHEAWVRASGIYIGQPSHTPDRLTPTTLFFTLCLSILTASTIGALADSPLLIVALPLPFVATAYLRYRRSPPLFGLTPKIHFSATFAIFFSSAIYLLPPQRVLFGGQVAVEFATVAVILAASIGIDHATRRGVVSRSQSDPFSETSTTEQRDFPLTLNRYCTALVAELDRYDREVNWSDRELTPLEAEVEAERSNRSNTKIVRDLVEAIRTDRASSVFVVLGDPGSGKSVSLRRLVRVLAHQAQRTGIVPVYVNLREYPTNNEPTPEAIVSFVRNVTSRQTGRDGRAFLDTWYERFRKTGRLFFVIDSFDELPAVLDCDDKSESHRRISQAFDRFFTQEVLSCRAVLASRHFRSPVYVDGTRLIIRPFTENQIRQALRIWLQGRGVDAARYVRALFQQRAHLAPLLRNPFTAELIAEHAISTEGRLLPDSMFAVFNHYISQRLASDEAMLAQFDVSRDDVRKGAGLIATAMYENSQSFGLEADFDDVVPLIDPACGGNAAGVIEALAYNRLARVGGGAKRRFAFVHRRFAEFFVVDTFNRDGGKIELVAIPSDSRWRDCLVLCCGVLDDPRRSQVANYCWTIIKKTRFNLSPDNVTNVRAAVHCTRFLCDAFRGDTTALADFDAALGEVACELIDANDMLVAKIGAELIPLIPEIHQQNAIVAALSRRSRWISDVTLSSCRHITSLSHGSHQALRKHFRNLPIAELFARYKEIDFSLSLSDAFRYQRLALRWDLIEVTYRALIAAVFVALAWLYAPILFVPVFGVAAFAWLIHYSIKDTARIGARGYNIVDALAMAARDPIDAWCHLLILGLPIFCLLATSAPPPDSDFGLARELLAQATWFDSIRAIVGYRSIAALALLVGILACLKWERFAPRAAPPPEREPQPRPVTIVQKEESPEEKEKERKRIKDIGNKLFRVVVTVMMGIATLVTIIIWLWGLLGEETKFKIKILTTCIPAALIIRSVGGKMIRAARVSLLRRRERRRLATMGVPSVVSCDELFLKLQSFQVKSVACEYVRSLRVRRTALVGELRNLPSDIREHRSVVEEFAMLREQWLGLER